MKEFGVVKMPRLSAKFSIDISSPCLLTWPDGQEPEIVIRIDNFEILINMFAEKDWRSKEKGDANWTTGLSRLEVTVSREEDESPPEVIKKPDGMKDLTAQSEYLRSKLPEYRAMVLEVSNRILLFFQYSLFTPLVRLIEPWDFSLNNPRWFDTNENELRCGGLIVVDTKLGVNGELGVKKLSPRELPSLVSFLSVPTEPSLVMKLLSDAQNSWFEGDLRHSVLSLAICTEVLAKRCFFTQDSPAGLAFDYLEDKAKVTVRVLDLIDAIAEEAFGRSYKKEDKFNYKQIDHLFRCRNKIVHRGELVYRDDSGNLIKVNASEVEIWWHAVMKLKVWIESL